MIETTVAEWFAKNGWTWNLKGSVGKVPDEEDVEKVLDEAARQLYNEPVGTILQVGRLAFEKRHTSIDVYMYVGEFI